MGMMMQFATQLQAMHQAVLQQGERLDAYGASGGGTAYTVPGSPIFSAIGQEIGKLVEQPDLGERRFWARRLVQCIAAAGEQDMLPPAGTAPDGLRRLLATAMGDRAVDPFVAAGTIADSQGMRSLRAVLAQQQQQQQQVRAAPAGAARSAQGGSRSSGFCYDCGHPNHWAGDSACGRPPLHLECAAGVVGELEGRPALVVVGCLLARPLVAFGLLALRRGLPPPGSVPYPAGLTFPLVGAFPVSQHSPILPGSGKFRPLKRSRPGPGCWK